MATSFQTLLNISIKCLPFISLEGQADQDIGEVGMPCAQQDIILLVLRTGLVLAVPVSMCLWGVAEGKWRSSMSLLGIKSPMFPAAKLERIKTRLPAGTRNIRIRVLIVLPASGLLGQIRRKQLIAHLSLREAVILKSRDDVLGLRRDGVCTSALVFV